MYPGPCWTHSPNSVAQLAEQLVATLLDAGSNAVMAAVAVHPAEQTLAIRPVPAAISLTQVA